MAAVSLHQRLFAHCSTKKAAEQRGQSSPAFYRYFFHISPFYCTYIVMRSIQPFYHTALGVVWIVPVVVNPHKQNLSGAAFQCLDVTPDLTVAKPKSSLCFISSCRESVKFFSRDHLPVVLSCSQRPRGVKKADCSALHIHCLTLKLVHIAHGISALLRAFFLPYARPSCMTNNRVNNGSQRNKKKNA